MKFVIHQREGKGASGLAPNRAIRARGLHELQPNDCNISAQNIAILSAQHLQAPAQTIATIQHNISQHCWAQQVVRDWSPYCNVLRHVGY